MNAKNEQKLQSVKKFLDNKGIFYTELANGQLQVNTVNLWVTTEKFYDTETGYKNKGVNNFINYLKKRRLI